MSGTRPRIGLTTYYREAAWGDWRRKAALVPDAYLQRVVATGGTPLLLPPAGGTPDTLAVLDGLILIGGADIEATSYAATPHPRTVGEAGRDQHEVELARAAVEQGVPLLAICRGAQVLNVALGGTLLQHLPDVLGHQDYQPSPGEFGQVTFATVPDSLAARTLGPQASAPCYHHQAIDQVATHLRVTARSEDGVIQAVEPLHASSFALGVQFHPEENPEDSRLFEALVTAARLHSHDRLTTITEKH